jgi:single-stranded-DNA-specific exonuclease
MQGFAQSNGLSTHELETMLDLVAVSIAADIVPLTGENRVMTYFGLRRLNNNPCVGLKSIIKLCGLTGKVLTISDIIFKIGPRINASGRMESGQESVELLVTRNPIEANEISKRIDNYNRNRKELDRQITVEANEIVERHAHALEGKKPIVIYDQSWHKGVIGIVASRLAELHFRPSVVLTYSNGLATGSSRSVRGFDVYTAIKSCRDLLETFGGHTNAVGLSIKEENIPEFRRRLTEYVEEHIEDEQVTPAMDIDCEIKFSEINGALLRYLRMLNPYGPGNSKPVFITRKVFDAGSSKVVGKKMEHIKLDLVDEEGNKVLNAIAFGMAGFNDALKAGKPIDICYTIEETRHRMSTSVQLMVKAIKLHDDAEPLQANS